jgi:hypothetical protein
MNVATAVAEKPTSAEVGADEISRLPEENVLYATAIATESEKMVWSGPRLKTAIRTFRIECPSSGSPALRGSSWGAIARHLRVEARRQPMNSSEGHLAGQKGLGSFTRAAGYVRLR